MMKSPPGTQIMNPQSTASGTRPAPASCWSGRRSAPKLSPAANRGPAAFVSGTGTSLGFREGFWHEVERRSRRDQLFLLGAVLEVPDDALRVLHHPPAYVALVDRLAFLRVFLQVRDAREAKRQLRVVEM